MHVPLSCFMLSLLSLLRGKAGGKERMVWKH